MSSAAMKDVPVIAFVDNFFAFAPKAQFAAVEACLDGLFLEAGIPLHERVCGAQFPGLGWEWDLERQIMTCPAAKFSTLKRLLQQWHHFRTSMTLPTVETACGLVMWYSAGVQAFRPHVSPLIAMRTKGEAIFSRLGGDKRQIKCAFTVPARQALDRVTEIFLAWDGQCPMVQGFGPTASWQVLGRVDASTDWGCGGFAYDGTVMYGFKHKWTQDERDLAKCEVRESSGVFEVLGACYWLQHFGKFSQAKRVQLDLDNSSAVTALEKAFSPTHDMCEGVNAARALCAEHFLCMRFRFVRGKEYNQVADFLSHDRWAAAVKCALRQFGAVLKRGGGQQSPIIF